MKYLGSFGRVFNADSVFSSQHKKSTFSVAQFFVITFYNVAALVDPIPSQNRNWKWKLISRASKNVEVTFSSFPKLAIFHEEKRFCFECFYGANYYARNSKQLINARSQNRGISIIIFNCRHQREQKCPP